MAATIWPVTDDFVAEIGDVDLATPLSAENVAIIKGAFAKFAVLIFPDQTLTQEQHLDFARNFGPLEDTGGVYGGRRSEKSRIRTDLGDVSNLSPDGKIWPADSRLRMVLASNKLWHADSSFKFVPANASLLYSHEVVPVGGMTEFADQRAAYDALSDDMKRKLEGLIVEHSFLFSRERMGFFDFTEEERISLAPVPQLMVRTIPESGRKTLFLSSHAGQIRGMDKAEGRALIDQLLEHATQRQFLYRHRWRRNDVVIWDNRCTLHRGRDFDDLRYKREMHRATVSDQLNSCEREGVSVAA